MCHGCGKDPRGSGRSPTGHSLTGLCCGSRAPLWGEELMSFPVNGSHLCLGELGLWIWVRGHLSCKQGAKDGD